MLTSMEGVYRSDRIELLERPRQISDETPVIVTFLTVKDTIKRHWLNYKYI